MEPTLQDRETILFDKDDRELKRGGIFIIQTQAGLFVKRVSLKTDGSLELISDNKSYNSETIPPAELESVSIIGKVIGKISLI